MFIIYCRYRNEQERNEHCITHWTSVPYSCGICNKTTFSQEAAEKHFKQCHPSLPMNIITSTATINRELKLADELHLNEVRQEVRTNAVICSMSPLGGAVKEVNITDILTPSEATGTEISGNAESMEDPLGKSGADFVDVCSVNNSATNMECEVNICYMFIIFVIK